MMVCNYKIAPMKLITDDYGHNVIFLYFVSTSFLF